LGDAGHGVLVDAIGLIAHQRLAREFQQDAAISGRWGHENPSKQCKTDIGVFRSPRKTPIPHGKAGHDPHVAIRSFLTFRIAPAAACGLAMTNFLASFNSLTGTIYNSSPKANTACGPEHKSNGVISDRRQRPPRWRNRPASFPGLRPTPCGRTR